MHMFKMLDIDSLAPEFLEAIFICDYGSFAALVGPQLAFIEESFVCQLTSLQGMVSDLVTEVSSSIPTHFGHGN